MPEVSIVVSPVFIFPVENHATVTIISDEQETWNQVHRKHCMLCHRRFEEELIKRSNQTDSKTYLI